jgi:Uma2 family endonuclease
LDAQEIVLPLTKPETEWVRGRAVQKVSPFRNHARIQLVLGKRLDEWSGGRGEVGTEWRFRIAPPREARRPLVPDLAFVAAEQLRGLTIEEVQAPAFAPRVAVEIVSPGDNRRDLASKIAVYLGGGSALVIVIDPADRTALLHDASGSTKLTAADVLQHAALPGFELQLGTFFEEALTLSA